MSLNTITLIYDTTQGTVTAEPAAMKMLKGDGLQFVSSSGPVRVLMVPSESFSAAEFRTGDDPLTGITSGRFNYCCGVTIQGKVVGYPLNRDSGNEGEIVEPGSGTTR